MATIKLGKEPGVYVQEEVNPALAIVESRLKVAGVVASSAPQLVLRNVAVLHTKSGTDVLEGYDVVSVSSVSDYLNADGSNLPQYIQQTEPVEQEPTDTEEDEVSEPVTQAEGSADYKVEGNKIIWLGANEPVVNSFYYVNMLVNKTGDFFTPKPFQDAASAIAYYGPELYEDEDGNQVVNNLSLAIRLMFDNGADVVYGCQAENTIAGLKAGIDALEDSEIQSIICITDGLGSADDRKEVQQYLKQRVVIASATENQRERVGFVSSLQNDPLAPVEDGYYLSTSPAAYIEAVSAEARSFSEQRIVHIAPAKCKVNVAQSDGSVIQKTLSSEFVGAAMIGMLVNNARPVSNPLTRKSLVGIADVTYKLNRQQTESLSATGSLVVKERNGNLIINQAITTDTTNQNNRELSVVLIKDEVLKELRYNLDKEYIGTAYDRNRTPAKIKTSVVTILNAFLTTLIADFDMSDIVVTPDDADTTRVNVSLAFSVLRPLNYIYLSFMIKM